MPKGNYKFISSWIDSGLHLIVPQYITFCARYITLLMLLVLLPWKFSNSLLTSRIKCHKIWERHPFAVWFSIIIFRCFSFNVVPEQMLRSMHNFLRLVKCHTNGYWKMESNMMPYFMRFSSFTWVFSCYCSVFPRCYLLYVPGVWIFSNWICV